MLPLLAELSDKEPSLWVTFFVSACLALIAVPLYQVRWWLILFPTSLVIYATAIRYHDLLTTNFGASLISEMGWSHFIIETIATVTPITAVLIGLWIKKKTSLCVSPTP